jgi:hypothetical protein
MTGSDPLLLVGPQRSGTTALGAVLATALEAHGGCFTVNGKLPYLLRRWWTDGDAAARHLRADDVAHALGRVTPLGDGSAEWLARAQDALRASARRAACSPAAPSVTAEIRRVCAEAYGPVPWGDKYNEYLLDLPWLHAIFPDARWIFLVREPGESVASMLAWTRDKPWNPDGAVAAAAKWAEWTSRWLTFRDSVPARRRVELDYADLCAGRHDALSELVGLDLSPFLDGFQRPARTRPPAPLSPDAQAVRDALVRLGILGGHLAHQVSSPRSGGSVAGISDTVGSSK